MKKKSIQALHNAQGGGGTNVATTGAL